MNYYGNSHSSLGGNAPDDDFPLPDDIAILTSALKAIIYVAEHRAGPAAGVVLPHIITIAHEALAKIAPDEHEDYIHSEGSDLPF